MVVRSENIMGSTFGGGIGAGFGLALGGGPATMSAVVAAGAIGALSSEVGGHIGEYVGTEIGRTLDNSDVDGSAAALDMASTRLGGPSGTGGTGAALPMADQPNT